MAQPFLLLFQPRGVISFAWDALATIQFQNPTRDVVEKISVMSNRDDRARVTLQMMFEPRYRLGIQMIRRLVEQKNIGLLQEQPAQRNPATFAAGQDFHRRVRRRTAQRIHRHLQPRVEIPGILMVELLLHFALTLEQFVHFVVGHLLRRTWR